MAKGRKRAALKKSPLQLIHDRDAMARDKPDNAPTAEARLHGQFGTIAHIDGRKLRRIPPIDTLREAGKLTEKEHRALSFYRDQADAAERSEVKSCLAVGSGGGRGGKPDLPAATVSAILATARIERDLGELQPIARAIAVDDKSISQWCIDRHGGRERYDGAGKCIAIVPVNEKQNTGLALLELRMAAHRIVP